MWGRRAKNWLKASKNMPIRWALVAAQAEARIFEQIGNQIRVVARLEHPQGKLLSQELKEGKPGRSFASWRGSRTRHAMAKEKTPKEEEEERFARTVALVIERDRQEKRFDELVVVAEPKFLGLILNDLSPQSRRRVVEKIHADLSNLNDRAVIEYLQGRRGTQVS